MKEGKGVVDSNPIYFIVLIVDRELNKNIWMFVWTVKAPDNKPKFWQGKKMKNIQRSSKHAKQNKVNVNLYCSE
jgi:hypothetical protein